MTIRYPHIYAKLVGEDGNAFAIMGRVTKALHYGGIDKAEAAGATVFHAGTGLENGNIVATGGRVLGVTALGDDITQAQSKAYRAVDLIDWPEGFCRRDIGWRAIRR